MNIILFSLFVFWQDVSPEIYQEGGIAIKGYDVVAYYSLGEARLGTDEFAAQWQGAYWYFSSEKNRELFKKDPDAYLPQFGGYCAWGMREGYKAESDPQKAWTIFEGKLYLNYNESVMRGWLPEKEESIRIATRNWRTFQHSQ